MPTEAQESHPGRWQRSCQTSTWQQYTPLIATRGAVLLPLHRHMQWPHHCLPYLSKLTLQLKTAVIPQYFQHECTFSLNFPNFSVCFSRSDFTSPPTLFLSFLNGSITLQYSLSCTSHVYPCLHKLCSSWEPLCFTLPTQIPAVLGGQFMFTFC